MKAVEQPESQSFDERHGALADQFLQDNGYLPSQDDQSWRERAALGIVTRREEDIADDSPDMDFVPEDHGSAREAARSGRGGVFAALFMVLVMVPVVAALTFPNILMPGFWRAHAPDAGPGTVAPSPPTQLVDAPSSLRASLDAHAPQPSPKESAAPLEQRLPSSSGPPAKANSDSEKPLTIDATGATAAAAAPGPTPRPVPETGQRHNLDSEHDTGGFYAKAMGPDGVLRYQYFSSEPSQQPTPGPSNRAEADVSNRQTGRGFYAMVARPDGTLQYRYFSSQPSR